MPKLWKSLALFFGVLLALMIIWPEAKYTPFTPNESYLADSAAYDLPAMPQGWEWNYHAASDGTKLRYGTMPARETDRAVVITVPGYTSSMDMYGEHVGLLAARGYRVMGFDLRGQGGSARHRAAYPEKLYAKNFGVYSDDLAGFIKAQNFNSDRPVVLLGSSFGGHVSMRMAGDHDTQVDGLVLLAPVIAPNTAPFPFWLTKAMTGFAGLIGKGEAYAPGQGDWVPDGEDLTLPSTCASEPKRLYLRDTLFVRKPEQRVGGATNNYVYGMITSGERLKQRDYAARIDLPIRMVTAQKDIVVDGPMAEAACRDSLPNCTLIRLPDTGHCLMLENDAVLANIFDELDKLTAQLISAP